MSDDSYSTEANEPKGSSTVLFDNRIWLSTDEAARYLGKTRNAIWILLSRGHLIKRKWKRRLYFKKSELDRLLETSLN
jgi:hypothetical protein